MSRVYCYSINSKRKLSKKKRFLHQVVLRPQGSVTSTQIFLLKAKRETAKAILTACHTIFMYKTLQPIYKTVQTKITKQGGFFLTYQQHVLVVYIEHQDCLQANDAACLENDCRKVNLLTLPHGVITRFETAKFYLIVSKQILIYPKNCVIRTLGSFFQDAVSYVSLPVGHFVVSTHVDN